VENKEQKRVDLLILLLRIGVAFPLFYAAIAGFVDPNSWIGFFPSFTTNILPAETLIGGFGIIEILVALGLLFMKNPFYPAVLSVLMLVGIIGFNIPQMDILFRDVSIALMAIALAVYFHKKG